MRKNGRSSSPSPFTGTLLRLGCLGLFLLLASYLYLHQSTSLPTAESDVKHRGDEQAQHEHTPPHIISTRHVEGEVWGGYWAVDTDYSPHTPGRGERAFKGRKGSCHDLASQVCVFALVCLLARTCTHTCIHICTHKHTLTASHTRSMHEHSTEGQTISVALINHQPLSPFHR